MSTGDPRDFFGNPWDPKEDDAKISQIDRKQMEIDRLTGNLLSIQVRDQQEEIMRLTHPSVQDAWEQYQAVLKLVSKQ